MDRPIITIDLKKHLHDFLLHEFEVDKTGAILLTNRHYIGSYINLMWDASKYPVPIGTKENPVRLSLPLDTKYYHVKCSKFLYVSDVKEQIIQNFLEREFRMRVRFYFIVGYEKKFKQKQIIESFLKNYGMKHNAISFDQIKKMDYRNRVDLLNNIKNEIQHTIIQ
jgi:hypothetical protein